MHQDEGNAKFVYWGYTSLVIKNNNLNPVNLKHDVEYNVLKLPLS